MNICIIGDSKCKDQMKILEKELISQNNTVNIPIFNYKENLNHINFYNFAKESILNSDYVIIIVNDKNDKTFIFNFGMVFGTNKKFKIVSKINIEKILCNKKKEYKLDEKSSKQ